jgi:hypothetical protein
MYEVRINSCFGLGGGGLQKYVGKYQIHSHSGTNSTTLCFYSGDPDESLSSQSEQSYDFFT